ncbi:MAG: hypothetical protein JSV91_12020 [Phycisphaerales bacterium]|nr:MAG: hypothetical protein JSV91_12020 [Phycisphaerales bacterium]
MEQMPTVMVSEHLAEQATEWLGQRCRVVACPVDDPGFAAALAEADGLIVRTYTIVDEALLRLAPRLRVVGRAGAGLDNIDVAACRARGIEVVHTPDANTQAVVEYVLCLMCDALRPRVMLDNAVDERMWKRLRAEVAGRLQMNEITLGILGLGRIGKRVASVASGLGCEIIYNDLLTIRLELRFGAAPVAVEELFERADVLSIHIDGRASNRDFVGGHLIGRMKPEVVFLNTARGFVVDNLALERFLQQHPAAQAHLDVHEPEPFDEAYPLLGLPNARLYPHLASRTETAMLNMSWVVRDVWAVLEGNKPQWPAPAL